MTTTSSIKLFSLLALVLCAHLVNAQSSPNPSDVSKLINALMPGSTDNQGMSILESIPPGLKAKIPPEIQQTMQTITVSQLKQDMPKLKEALKKCLMMSTVKECIQELKKIDPEVNKLLSQIKQKAQQKMQKVKQSVMNFLSQLKPMLNSPLLQNIVQTMMNVISPPASRRRRKRDTTIVIVSLRQAPMSLQQIIQMIKNLLKKIKMELSKPPPPGPLSTLQQAVNALSKASSNAKTLFSNPSMMKLLGTSPPS